MYEVTVYIIAFEYFQCKGRTVIKQDQNHKSNRSYKALFTSPPEAIRPYILQQPARRSLTGGSADEPAGPG